MSIILHYFPIAQPKLRTSFYMSIYIYTDLISIMVLVGLVVMARAVKSDDATICNSNKYKSKKGPLLSLSLSLSTAYLSLTKRFL